MNLKKTVAALLLAAILAAALGGCGYNPEKVLTVDGTEVSSGEYLYAQYVAFTLIMDENDYKTEKELLKGQVDGVAATELVHERTLQLLRENEYVRDEFERLELELDAWTEYMAEYYAGMYWNDYGVGTLMEKNGVSFLTYKEMVRLQYMTSFLFSTYYGEGGEREVSVADLKEYYNANYADALVIAFPSKALDSSGLSDEQLAAFKSAAELIVAACDAGSGFKDAVVLNYPAVLKALMSASTEYSSTDFDSAVIDKTFTLSDTSTYSEAFITALIEKGEGAGWFIEDNQIYVYMRSVNFTTDDEFKELQSTALESMKYEEFTDSLTENSAGYEIVANEKAVKYYSVKNVAV